MAELYDRHAARVMGLAYRIVRNSSDAEDVVQEVFSQAWRTAPNYQATRGTVAGWLLMMARTRAIDRLRSRQARRDSGAEPDLEALPSDATSQPDQIIANQRAANVRAAIRTLPAEQQTALELAYFEGLTQTEIAERLRIPLGTVKTRIRSALASLRRSVQVMTMDRHVQIADKLEAYVLGELPAHESREVDAHLRACAACAEEVRELSAVLDGHRRSRCHRSHRRRHCASASWPRSPQLPQEPARSERWRSRRRHDDRCGAWCRWPRRRCWCSPSAAIAFGSTRRGSDSRRSDPASATVNEDLQKRLKASRGADGSGALRS